MVIEKKKINAKFMAFISLVPAIFAFVLTKNEKALFVLIGFPIVLIMLWCASTAWKSRKGFIKLSHSFLEVQDGDDFKSFAWEDIKKISMLKDTRGRHGNCYWLVVYFKNRENTFGRFTSAFDIPGLNGGFPMCDLASYKGKKETNLAKIRQKLRLHQIKESKPINEDFDKEQRHRLIRTD